MSTVDISENQFLERLNALDGVRQFFVQVWRENPGLLKHGDPKLIELMTPIWEWDRLAKDDMAKPA